jgi:hypothetical protein
MLAACGGTDTAGVGGYVDTVATTTEQMTRAAFDALPPGAAPTRSQIAEVVAARRTALDTISVLTPPAEMRPEHQSLVRALRSLVIASEDFIEANAALDPDAFLEALEASTNIDALADTVSLACAAWEIRAADLGHAVELGC